MQTQLDLVEICPCTQLDTCLPAGREHQPFENMYTVYSLKSEKDGRIYVGITGKLEQRIKEHNAGKTKSTKGYRPWFLLHSLIVENRMEARKLEKKWKSGSGKVFLKSIDKCAHSSVG